MPRVSRSSSNHGCSPTPVSSTATTGRRTPSPATHGVSPAGSARRGTGPIQLTGVRPPEPGREYSAVPAKGCGCV
ncbi:Uncharacterised protein [Mycobacteroides abscessus]|nr:Uncharacterised protein [Mycobacteroides abscessus]